MHAMKPQAQRVPCAGFVHLCILSVPFAFSIKAGE